MHQSPLLPVSFHGDTIFCLSCNGEPYTPLRPIVENMGLDWSAQHAKIKSNLDRWGTVAIITTVQDGKQRETLCIPVRKLPAFMASINPKKVSPALRPKIELYQAECDDALWSYWSKGHAERQAALPAASVRFSLSTSEERQPLRELVSEWVKLTGMISGKAWGRINERFKLRQIGDLPREMMPEAMDFVRERIELARRAMLPEEAPAPARPASQPTAPQSDSASTFELVSPPVREARKEASVDFPRRVMALPAGRPQDGFDQNELDSALRRAEDLNSSYSMAMRDLVEELRMPFGAARQDDQLPERVRTFATSVMYGLSDMQTACTLIHNAVLSSVRMAADGCRVLSETR